MRSYKERNTDKVGEEEAEEAEEEEEEEAKGETPRIITKSRSPKTRVVTTLFELNSSYDGRPKGNHIL